ncbi:MAG: hypothetical protein BVN33_16540 [Proteobacteria bacterium ST_bin13]|nr:MAG: hypothetical protein BVN33_16540 [Proteobacteria bacterium ST_bin13]
MHFGWKVFGKFVLASAIIVAALAYSVVVTVRYDATIAQLAPKRDTHLLAIEAASELSPEARTAALLELEIVERRYDQAQAAMLSKMWTRNMGFVTGMLIALLGAAFVVAELRVDASEVTGLQMAIKSSSPGLILCTIGSALVVVSLSVTYRVDARDTPVYFRQVESRYETPKEFPQESPDATSAVRETDTNTSTSKGAKNAQDEIRRMLGR